MTGTSEVNQLDHHPGLLGLVDDELPQLVESPATDAVALRLAKSAAD